MTGDVLRVDWFTGGDLADISEAGTVFAAALADISHHHIGEPGCWDCYGAGPDEIARLRDALDQMATAIAETRRRLASLQRRVRRNAGRPARGWSR